MKQIQIISAIRALFKNSIYTLLLLSFATGMLIAQEAKPTKPTYVIVHGAWGGSWAFKEIEALLREKGCDVYRPSLTGQGERVHLATLETGLDTHIKDVVNMFIFEDLHDVILVGHSYGGMVITGVADSLPGRINSIIYMDAMIPEDGESAFTMRPTGNERLLNMNQNGFLIPPWLDPNATYPKDVPHPLKTLTDIIHLKGRAAHIPTNYILTVDKGQKPSEDGFYDQSLRAKKRGWPITILEADHNPQWSVPIELTEMLYSFKPVAK